MILSKSLTQIITWEPVNRKSVKRAIKIQKTKYRKTHDSNKNRQQISCFARKVNKLKKNKFGVFC